MSKQREILIIGTYGIDIFHGIIEEMERHQYLTFTTTSHAIALEYLQNRRFDAIIINLEPDGRGGVAESELLLSIADAPMQSQAICLGVSAHYPHSLPQDSESKHLKILAGWLTLPVKPAVLANHILKLIESDHPLTVKDKLDA